MPPAPVFSGTGTAGARPVYVAAFRNADGSVRSLSYTIDPLQFQYLGNRNDGQAIGGDE